MLLLTQGVQQLQQPLRLQQLLKQKHIDFVHHLTLQIKTASLKDVAVVVAVAVQYVHQEFSTDVLTYKGENK